MIDIHKIKGYSGYGVPCVFKYKNTFGSSNNEEIKHFKLEKAIHNLFRYDYPNYTNIEYIKLILRSIEDLTDEELLNICDDESVIFFTKPTKKDCIFKIRQLTIDGFITKNTLDYFHQQHIDYQDLIGQGLAIKKENE